VGISFAIILGVLAPTMAWSQSIDPHDLIKTDLADLMNMEVTSVSRKEQKLSKTAAAAYVITQEDIHRSGATNIPDLLRMVPGLEVAQIDQNAWAISSRGFNDEFANKLLVLVDGRTVYDPAFSGVMWDDLMVPLADIERIEVIRGPGAAIWGANAVNGVINIITKAPQATQGGLVEAGGGNQTASGLIQYGGKTRDGAYRFFSDYSNYANLNSSLGGGGVDGQHFLHGGFRSDLDLSARDSVRLKETLSTPRQDRPLPASFRSCRLSIDFAINPSKTRAVTCSDAGREPSATVLRPSSRCTSTTPTIRSSVCEPRSRLSTWTFNTTGPQAHGMT
jgi:iron complex outermembrane recepter protein